MLKLLHMSDLHFGPPYLETVGESLVQASHHLGPDLVIASGDFTQRARPEQFQAARQFLDSLPDVPCVVVPGNHDIPLYRVWERLTSPYQHYRDHISSELDSVIHHDNACIVALNSTSPYRAIKNGRVRRKQLDLCERAFNEASHASVRIVVAHHHFAPAPDYERSQAMPKAKRALDRFHELGVDLILGGHLHRAYVGNSLDIYPGSDRQRGIIIVQCGTSTSRRGRAREREKNSFNLISIDHTIIMVDHFMYFSEDERFAPVSRYIFPRGNQHSLELS